MIEPTTRAVAVGSPNLLTNSLPVGVSAPFPAPLPFAGGVPSAETDGWPCAACLSDIEASRFPGNRQDPGNPDGFAAAPHPRTLALTGNGPASQQGAIRAKGPSDAERRYEAPGQVLGPGRWGRMALPATSARRHAGT